MATRTTLIPYINSSNKISEIKSINSSEVNTSFNVSSSNDGFLSKKLTGGSTKPLDDKTITFDANDDKTVILTDEFKVFLYVLSKRPEELLRRYHHGLTMMNQKNFYDKLIISF